MRYILILIAILIGFYNSVEAQNSTRKERNFIKQGNAYYRNKQFSEAMSAYKSALSENPNSTVALFNQGLAKYQMANMKESDKTKAEGIAEAAEIFSSLAKHASGDANIAAKANYNLGNIAYKQQNYQEALDYYKQSLRLAPDNDAARKNLRLTQLKLKQNENKSNNNDKKQNQDKQNQDKKDNKKNDQQNQSQNKNDNNEQQPQNTPQPQESSLSQNAANQILKRGENKEKETRARLLNQSQINSRRINSKNW